VARTAPTGLVIVRAPDALTLLDWKRRVFALYEDVRSAADPAEAWRLWRAVRDDLFANHPQSPLPPERREEFGGLSFYDYDPAARALAEVGEAEPRTYEIATSGEGAYSFTRIGLAAFELGRQSCELEIYWLEGYGGGIFLPFADATSGDQTYGAGRYLFDTVKGADLGADDGKLVLDFNFAYNPSCCYDPRWVCPLAPQPNRIAVPVEAGEQAFTSIHSRALR
jgi:uncharacterized protein (DUF1684 family)